MKNSRFNFSVLLALVVFVCSTVHAQKIVHAVSGVVTAIDPAANSITIKTNDGSDGSFQYRKSGHVDLAFDKEVRNGTVEPASFNKIGDNVIAYYVDDRGDVNRTIVALKDFGPTPLESVSGTVVKAGRHMLVLKTDKGGAAESFSIAKDASAETPSGVVSGSHFDAQQGDHLTLRYTEANGSKVAQFIRNTFG
jgi:hypothetical protein